MAQKLRQEQIQTQKQAALILKTAALLEATPDELDKQIDRIVIQNKYVSRLPTSSTDTDLRYRGFHSAGDQSHAPYKADRTPDRPSPQQHLLEQISYLLLPPVKQQVAEYIASNLEPSGYLKRSTRLLVQELALEEGLDLSEKEVESVIKQLQTLDPPGIAARNVQECLLLQLKRFKQTPQVKTTIQIVGNHFDLLVNQRFKALTSYLPEGIHLSDVRKLLRKLQPHPWPVSGHLHDNRQITPSDFWVGRNTAGKLEVVLNPSRHPRLHLVSSSITHAQKEVEKQFYQQQIGQAKLLIHALEKRRKTLRDTMQAIVHLQGAFFLSEGVVKQLRPLYMKQIAQRLGVNPSTISRAVNQRYVATEFGRYPLNYFFSEGIPTKQEGLVSSQYLKERIKELTEKEPPNKPHTDTYLTHLLQEEGFQIARRTVGKYREALGIPTGRKRQRLPAI